MTDLFVKPTNSLDGHLGTDDWDFNLFEQCENT